MVKGLAKPVPTLKKIEGGNILSANEFLDRFDVLFNNITSNQAPGLNVYEISVFLTKAQDEILKNYFLPQSNTKQAGFDGNQKRQIDFSSITKVAHYVGGYTYSADGTATDGAGHQLYTRTVNSLTPPTYSYSQAYDSGGQPITDRYIRDLNSNVLPLSAGEFDQRGNTKSAGLPTDIMMIINEKVIVTRGTNTNVELVVRPLTYEEYDRLMSKPFKRPVKSQAWRLINNASGNNDNRSDLIVGPTDIISDYIIRYVKRPNPIIVGNLDGLTINGVGNTSDCELDPILHEEILQRAVELAKIAWTNNGQDNLQAVIQAGQRSE